MSPSSQPPTSPAALPWRRWLLVFGLALGVLAGSAFPIYRHYDFSHSRDTLTYLRVARGEFRGSSLTRRYRIVVPFVAAAVAWPLERLGAAWPLRLAFYLVNTLLLAAAGLLIFRTCLLYGAAPPAAALALVAVLSSRWAMYTAGLPLVDSLYVLVFALAFYAARAGAAGALVLCILLGPHAKESFVFLAPWLLIFGQRAVRWPAQLAWLALSAALAYAVRHWINDLAGDPPQASVQNAFAHFANVAYSLRLLFSAHGAGDVASIFGFFTLFLLVGLLGGRAAVRGWLTPVGGGGAALLAVVLVHMLLSGDLARMGYLSSPVFAVALSLLLTRHPAFRWLTQAQTDSSAE